MASALKSRVEKLDRKNSKGFTVLTISRPIIEAQTNEIIHIKDYCSIVGGQSFRCDDFESDDAFEEACNEEHFRVYGEPMPDQSIDITIGGE